MSMLPRRLLFAVLAAAVAGGALAWAQEEGLIKVDVQVVNVLATVRDKQGNLVTNLEKDDFVVTEDGEPQEIRYFSRQADLPLTVGLLIDTSVSQQRLLYEERSAGYQFLDGLLRLEKDLAFLMSFDVDIELLQDLTGSRTLLQEGLEMLEIQGSSRGYSPTPGPVPTSSKPVGTALYDGVYLAATEMLRPQVGRKAIVLISDGNDYGSKVSLDEAVAEAHKSDAVIYAVRYFDRRFYAYSGAIGAGGGSALKKLAEHTGGSVFEVTRKQSLEDILEQINEEIRNQYSIGYSPSRDLAEGGFRRIKLETKHKGLEVHAREGYYPEAVADF